MKFFCNFVPNSEFWYIFTFILLYLSEIKQIFYNIYNILFAYVYICIHINCMHVYICIPPSSYLFVPLSIWFRRYIQHPLSYLSTHLSSNLSIRWQIYTFTHPSFVLFKFHAISLFALKSRQHFLVQTCFELLFEAFRRTFQGSHCVLMGISSQRLRRIAEQWRQSHVSRKRTKVKIGKRDAVAAAAWLALARLIDWLIDGLIDYWRVWLMPRAFALFDSMRESVERAELSALWRLYYLCRARGEMKHGVGEEAVW